MTKDPIRYLSLAAKAGKLIIGADECEQAVRRGRSGLLILAADAGISAERCAGALSETGQVQLIKTVYKKTDLAASVGRGSPVALALVTDKGLASAFIDAAANGMEQEERI